VSDAVPYERLTPDLIIDSVESCGFECTGSILPLASYENRVYQIGTADGFVVAKFYRPGRWSTAAILEEHDFSLELSSQDIPVVPPLVYDGASLHERDGYRFAVYERRGGRWPELGTSEDREWLGRFLGRIHAVGAVRRFRERPTLDRVELGARSAKEILGGDWLPPHLVASYERVTEQLVAGVETCFAEVGSYRELRIHGDCHRGNVLWTDQGPHFVDLDDCMNGPAVQDLWLFLAGSRDDMAAQLGDLLEGYGKFADFDFRELRLVEALRALRLMHYTAWITRRWHDPAFPRAFPWLGEARYWEQHVQALLEQCAALDEPPLAVLV
jgi:Ser/Thr protein kinase RdoA (MazF antagonist)